MTRAATAVVSALAVASCGGREPPPAPAPAKPQVHFEQAAPDDVPDRPRGRHLTARLNRPTLLRAAPGGRVLHRLGRRTEFGSRMVLSVVARRDGWLKVISAKLPNHRHGWIPQDAASVRGTNYEIRVDRSRRRATLRRGKRAVLRFTVAVGRPGNETPLGRFAVTDKLRPTDPTSPYGCCAVALSGHQTELEPGWPGGDRLAIHGTPATWSIGRPVSLGCMRAHRRALERLMRRVPLGAPVIIRA